MSASPVSTTPDWVVRSNENAKLMLDVIGQFAPEQASFLGVAGLDDRVADLGRDLTRRYLEAMRKAVVALRDKLATEKHPKIRQDLEIMLTRGDLSIRGAELGERLMLPYFNLNETIFQGLRALLDDQVPQERRQAALVRLRKYAGLEAGYEPLTAQAMARSRSWRRPNQVGPAKVEVETNLARAVKALEQDSIKAIAVAADLVDPQHAAAMVAKVEAELGPIDVLVNSAGAARRTPPAELTAEHWHAAMQAKYFTYVHAMDAVLRGMELADGGRFLSAADCGERQAFGDELTDDASTARAE